MAARMETVNAVTGATEIVIWYNEKWKIAAVSTVAGQCSVNEMVFDSDNLPSESRTSSGMAYPATSDKPAFAVCGAGVHAEYFRI